MYPWQAWRAAKLTWSWLLYGFFALKNKNKKALKSTKCCTGLKNKQLRTPAFGISRARMPLYELVKKHGAPHVGGWGGFKMLTRFLLKTCAQNANLQPNLTGHCSEWSAPFSQSSFLQRCAPFASPDIQVDIRSTSVHFVPRSCGRFVPKLCVGFRKCMTSEASNGVKTLSRKQMRGQWNEILCCPFSPFGEGERKKKILPLPLFGRIEKVLILENVTKKKRSPEWSWRWEQVTSLVSYSIMAL